VGGRGGRRGAGGLLWGGGRAQRLLLLLLLLVVLLEGLGLDRVLLDGLDDDAGLGGLIFEIVLEGVRACELEEE
jgi:hypothetical protein